MYIMTPVLKSSSLNLKYRPVHFSENSCTINPFGGVFIYIYCIYYKSCLVQLSF